jgi:tetrapyrrole methylase family protein/MazG family protein
MKASARASAAARRSSAVALGAASLACQATADRLGTSASEGIVNQPRDGALFERLVDIMARLRSPTGCPWDRAQDRTSLKPYLLEEAYEVLEAIDEGAPPKLREELGDLLLQVIFHAQIARERGEFDIYDVLEGTIAKMLRRHPHVFGDAAASTPQEALQNWEEIKRQEKAAQQATSVLDGVPRQLPSLLRAQRLQDKAARVGFDWQRVEQVWEKLGEELRELRAAAAAHNRGKVEEELGDVLFSLVNLARFLGVNPDEALHKTTSKFVRRFQFIERHLSQQGKTPKQATLAEMDALWEQAKQQE